VERVYLGDVTFGVAGGAAVESDQLEDGFRPPNLHLALKKTRHARVESFKKDPNGVRSPENVGRLNFHGKSALVERLRPLTLQNS